MADGILAAGACVRRIAIFRALQLGDWLCAIPAVRALRTACPNAHITLIGLPWSRLLVERYPDYLDEFLDFPGYPGLPERLFDAAGFSAFIDAAQARRFDLAIQMHGCGTITNPLVGLLGARAVAGFHRPGEFCPDAATFLPYPADLPEIWKHLRLMEFLGIRPCGEELEFPVRAKDEEALLQTPSVNSLRSCGYVCVHPGARARERRWPTSCFAAVADALARHGLPVVLTGSPDETSVTAAVQQAMQMPAIDLAGRTDLGALAALLRDARLLICNDTGVSHLAAALRVPSVVVFHNLSDREGWPPRDRLRHRAVSGVDGVTPDMVLEQVRELLVLPHRQPTSLAKEASCARCVS